jgi:hypothetical protein
MDDQRGTEFERVRNSERDCEAISFYGVSKGRSVRRLSYINPRNIEVVFDSSLFAISSFEGVGVPSINIQEQKSPYQDGAISIDQLVESRELTLNGLIAVGKNLSLVYRYMKELSSLVNPKLGPGLLTYTNDHGSWKINCTPVGPIFPNTNANEGNQKFQIVFHCHDPYWQSLISEELQLQNIVSLVEFPIEFVPGGIELASYEGDAVDAYNEGDVPTPITVRIYGPSTNPRLTKTSTGEFLRIIKTLATGDLIEIDTTPGSKSVYFTPDGGSKVNAINLLDFDSVFFKLDIGYNALQLTDDVSSPAIMCFVYWNNRFIGV